MRKIITALRMAFAAPYSELEPDAATDYIAEMNRDEYVHTGGILQALVWRGKIRSTFITSSAVVAGQAVGRRWLFRTMVHPYTKRNSDVPISTLFAAETDGVPDHLAPAEETIAARVCCSVIAAYVAPPPGSANTAINEIALGHPHVEVNVPWRSSLFCHNGTVHPKKEAARLNNWAANPQTMGTVFVPSRRPPKLHCQDTDVHVSSIIGKITIFDSNYRFNVSRSSRKQAASFDAGARQQGSRSMGGITIVVATCCGRGADIRYCTVTAKGVLCNACRESTRRGSAQPNRRNRNLINMCALCLKQDEKCVHILELHDSEVMGCTYELTVSALCPHCFTHVGSIVTGTPIEADVYKKYLEPPKLIISRRLMNITATRKGTPLAHCGFLGRYRGGPPAFTKTRRAVGGKYPPQDKRVSRGQQLAAGRLQVSLFQPGMQPDDYLVAL
jgi:hypothetical protein